MSTTIVMPKAGLTMVEGTISQWLVAEGAYVKKGDALMEYENEKNTIECDALADGYVHILAQEGDTIPVGEPIGILAESPEELAAMFQEELYDELDGPVTRIAALDVPMPYNIAMEHYSIPSVDRICASIRAMMD